MSLSVALDTEDDDDGWEFPHDHNKQLCVCEMMSLKAGRIHDPFPKDAKFTKQQLLRVRPSDIKAHLKFVTGKHPLVWHARIQPIHRWRLWQFTGAIFSCDAAIQPR